MKKILTIVILLVATFAGSQTFAQKQYKFGHIDSNALLSIMPERENAKVELEKYAKQLESTLTSMQSEFERKYQNYVVSADSLSKLLRETKEGELSEMQQRIQNFQQTAQQDLGEKENELLQPIIAKAKTAISEVSEEGGYLYVFDVGTGVVLHHSADSEDILPLVKVKLGIQ
ncbi:MAG: OmpH family outer membrane protein [Salinivirgaceae bacterium]|jgi:outer membrane protein|nr:OmpH family outer membrane protein [Salinivirgaceae bacterium]